MHLITLNPKIASVLSARRHDVFQFFVNTWCFKTRTADLLARVFREKSLRLFQSCGSCAVLLLWFAGKHNGFNICDPASLPVKDCGTVHLLVLCLSHKNIYASPLAMCLRLLSSAKFSVLPFWFNNRSGFRNAEGGTLIFCHQRYGKPEVPYIVRILSGLLYPNKWKRTEQLLWVISE